jgi:hypothetical protein
MTDTSIYLRGVADAHFFMSMQLKRSEYKCMKPDGSLKV